MTFYGTALLLVIMGAAMAVLDAALLLLTPWLLRVIARAPRDRRAGMILLARSAPLVGSLLFTALLVIPAWLAHEPAETGEVASPLLLLLAALSLVPFASGLASGGGMLLRTRERLASWRRRAVERPVAATPCAVLEVDGGDLAVCVGGYFKPTIYAATDVVDVLEPAEFRAVLAHETAHAHAHDPLRLLWMASCPDFLRAGRLDGEWRRAFARACEFAADAMACRRDPHTALDLAAGLLKVARLRLSTAPSGVAFQEVAVSSAFATREDIETRVRALLEAAEPEASVRPRGSWLLAAVVLGLVLGGGLATSVRVHAWTEAVGSTLSPR